MSFPAPDWLAHRAATLAGHAAVFVGDERITYADLDRRATLLAKALIFGGIEPGDRVALLAQNSLEFVEAVHAVPRASGILVPLNARLTPDELAWQLSDCGAKALLCHQPTLAAAREAAKAAGIPALPLPVTREMAATGLRDVYAPDDVHSIIYTSGTTGRPKGAMLTFGNFWASAAASAFNFGLDPNERWLACMPLFHVGGLSILLRSAIYGTTAMVHTAFAENAVNRALRNDRVTIVSVVATMLQRMLDADDLPFPETVRIVLVGGGPVPRPLLERSLARGLPVVQTYGLTEAASQVATISPWEAVDHLGSAGKPLVTTRLRVDAPPGKPGEILVAGPTVTPGYWANAGATAAAIVDGWLHTGDIGRVDKDGYLYVLDRRDDLIVSGGENVYPAEVEAALMAFPGISGAAVVGLGSEDWGHMVAAAVTAGPEVDLVGIEGFLSGRLAGYKVPKFIQRLDELPMTANGKVQRRKVREILEAIVASGGVRPATMRADG